jgi:pantoate--beta-alanine ligase
MLIFSTRGELRDATHKLHQSGRSIGFVPTMGYLHEGHLSLIRKSRQENDAVVVSIFVNPTQFGPQEDLEAYPRDPQRDQALLEKESIDIAFFPTPQQLYPDHYSTYVQVEGDLTENLCGRSRPGHFRGVATIVAKLLHLVSPQRAYFGQKDAQQVAVVTRMVKDLDMDVQIVACPTVREADGLAMSSRNVYLTPDQRRQAPGIFQALEAARAAILQGERKATEIKRIILRGINAITDADIDYVAAVHANTLSPVDLLDGPMLLAVAVKIGKTRLIDNIRLDV